MNLAHIQQLVGCNLGVSGWQTGAQDLALAQAELLHAAMLTVG